MFVFLIIIVRISSLKKREKIPYTLLGRISGGRYTLQGRSMTITNLNICVDTSIGSLFGHLVPLGSVESPTVAIMYDDVENIYVYIDVYIGIRGENWLSQQRPTYRVKRDSHACNYALIYMKCSDRRDQYVFDYSSNFQIFNT